MVNINPFKYTIYLDIDFDKLSFNGYVQIKLDINKDYKDYKDDKEHNNLL